MAIAKLVKLAEFDVLKTYNAGEVILHEGEYSNEKEIWFENAFSLKYKVQLVNSYGLKGV